VRTVFHQVQTTLCVLVRLLARGNMNRGISEGQATRGFLAVSLPDTEPVLTRQCKEGQGTKERGVSRVDQFRGEPNRYSERVK
jgi:hypothetical protein